MKGIVRVGGFAALAVAAALGLAACGGGDRGDPQMGASAGIPTNTTQPLTHNPAGPFGPP